MNKNVLLLSLCQALLTTGNVLLIAVSALIGQQLAPSTELITLPLALQFIGLMMSTIPASLIMDRIGRRRGFVLGNCFGIAGALACASALLEQQFALFCLGTLLLGIGIGFGTLYRFAAVDASNPGQQGRAISLVMAGGVIAAVLGPNIAVSSNQWFTAAPFIGSFYALVALYSLTLVLLSGVDIPTQDHSRQSGQGRPLGQILKQPHFIVAVLAATLAYSVMNLLMTATPLAMARCGFAFDQAARVIEWHVMGMFLPSFFTGHLIQRIGALRVILCGALLMLGCCAINLGGQEQWQFLSALTLLGVGWNFMFIGATQLVTTTYEEREKGKSQAANEFIIFTGVTLSSLSSGPLESILGWTQMNQIAIPLILLAVGACLLLMRLPQGEGTTQPQ
ncbi:MFS transporter [Aestuariirhabdus litorea]|uniref:MFS transporter n=1 Tax=Aestuariirhabdus litorea TaxID=2528527 RepID=A0A3P3VPN2_9GAMM|nr:MFS transporter [Aestuariirhabdus litorea]RRJ83616.1 MFS transporter [Aestuariirhabdus litorea]RWW96837.1 MFS transporter [Endozoicomonadaceae bacterium GTF-13]